MIYGCPIQEVSRIKSSIFIIKAFKLILIERRQHMSAVKNKIIEQENVRQKKNPSFTLIKKLFKSGIMAWVLVLAIWSIAASFSDPQFLPGPLAVWQGAVDLSQDGSLFLYIWVSFLRVITG